MAPEVLFEPFRKGVDAPLGSNLLKVAISAEVFISSLCNGNGACGKCKVLVRSGVTNPPTGTEELILGKERIEKGFRLACKVKVMDSLRVEVPPESMDEREISVEDITYPIEGVVLDNPFRVVELSISRSDLERTGSSDRAVLEKVGRGYRVSYQALKALNRRRGRLKGFAVVDEGEMEVMDLKSTPKVFGVAIDIGTTNISGALIDLINGYVLARGHIPNPQLSLGADMLTRLAFQRGKEGIRRLKRLILTGINTLVGELLRVTSSSKGDIYEVMVAGNPVMSHLFMGLDPRGLGLYPNLALSSTFCTMSKGDVQGLRANPSSRISVFPGGRRFVGGDIVAGILATGIHRGRGPVLMVDLGTNGEIVLACKGSLLATSASAGPSFEGHLSGLGMRSSKGAITWVRMGDDDRVVYGTWGGGRPKGICGSGMISFLAESIRKGLVDEKGRFVKRGYKGRWDERGFILVHGGETSTGEPIIVRNRDIQEIQKAKAAIATGIGILLDHAGLGVDDLERVYLTGSFGSGVTKEDALTIGLLPPLTPDRIEVVRDAPLKGLIMALLERKKVDEACEIASSMECIDMAMAPDFEERFLHALYLGGPWSFIQ